MSLSLCVWEVGSGKVEIVGDCVCPCDRRNHSLITLEFHFKFDAANTAHRAKCCVLFVGQGPYC